MIYARVIEDSINKNSRLITVEMNFPRFILSEVNTHKNLERNSASSRAIPVKKQLAKILKDPVYPVEFGTNKPGMSAGPPLRGFKADAAKLIWRTASIAAYGATWGLMKLNVHKQVANRIIEPFMWHRVIATATMGDWEHIFALRISPDAQPEISSAMLTVKHAINRSKPKTLGLGEWHLPYVTPQEREKFDIETLKKISTARCARVSYLTHDGEIDVQKDLALHDRLVGSNPIHASPLAHVATPFKAVMGSQKGPFRGWRQYRHEVDSY